MESEAITRKTRIDTKLQSGDPAWIIIPYSESLNTNELTNHAVEEYLTESGPADYALFVNGRLLGIIEAKKVSTDPQNVLEQAKRYSRATPKTIGNWREFKVPFLYSTNGESIWFLDVRHQQYYQSEITNFHTPDALEEMYEKNIEEYKNWFINTPIQTQRLREYQKEAIKSVENRIIDNQHKMLLAMATGTGKTFTTVSLVYRLIKSGFARRVLFLVDRKSLALQATQAFSSFETPEKLKFNQEYSIYSQRFRREDLSESDPFDINVLPEDHLVKPQKKHTFIYVSTIQRMALNLFGYQGGFTQNADDPEIETDAAKLDIPIHAFDVIIADECHRGYTSKDTNVWRAVLNHFDALKIGLTATPAAHTVAYFGKPVYRYLFDKAVLDGHLVDYQAIKITSNIRVNGIFLQEGELVEIKESQSSIGILDNIEDERKFDSKEIENKITSPDSNRKILEEIAGYAYEHEKNTGRFPKILIFAVNDIAGRSHCDQLVDIARNVFNKGDEFVQKITGSPTVDRPLQKIKCFRNRPEPKIVVTVDMLSTGVDIPQLEFIVFLRPVKSRILWTQMLGRGTRKCPDIHKEFFTIFDCFDGTLIEYFKNSTDFDIEIKEARTSIDISQVIENIYHNIEREYNVNRLIKRFRRIDNTMSAEAREEFAHFIKDGNINLFADQLKENLNTDFSNTMEILRNDTFKDLLKNYQRAKKVFYIAHESKDEVTSELLFKVKDTQLKPREYLSAFSEFIHENKDKIQSLRILFSNPEKWNHSVLSEIRSELKKNYFDEKDLQKAHKIANHKTLADIISIIKKADDNNNHLLTAEERVTKAIEQIITENTFNDEQINWLNYIKQQLIVDLGIEKEYFNVLPLFERNGGLSKVKRLFGEKLDHVIEQINYKIAA